MNVGACDVVYWPAELLPEARKVTVTLVPNASAGEKQTVAFSMPTWAGSKSPRPMRQLL